MSKSLMTILLLFICISSQAQTDSLSHESPEHKTKRLQWWLEGRFGMFIHWGPVSLEGTEISWSRGGERKGIEGTGNIPVEIYDNLYKKFYPVKFNAAEWVSIAKSAGMKYMVLTAKHCDGFCLWNSKVDDYNIGNSPFKRDVCGELSLAAHKEGMKIGWYYSPMDWRDTNCRSDRNDIYVMKMQSHLKELLGNYGNIDLLWFDAEGGPIPWHQTETYNIVRELQPNLIINDRLWLGRYADRNPGIVDSRADYKTPEQRVGAFDNKIPWETCMTLGTQWSWKPNDKIKTYEDCIRILVQCVTGDGNLLLNVGPMPDGRIEPRQVKVLKQIGNWLDRYGVSIYGTRGGPFKNGEWGGSTHKKNTIYLHISKWQDDELVLPTIDAKIIKSVSLTGGKVNVSQTAKGTVVKMAIIHRNTFDTIIKLILGRSADNIEAIEVSDENRIKAKDLLIHLKDSTDFPFVANGSKSLVDGVHGTTDRMDGKWLGNRGKDFEAVLDLGSEKHISKVVVGCLQEQVSLIFFPKTLSVSVSLDGKEFNKVGEINTNQPVEDALIKRTDFPISFQSTIARYIKINAATIGVCPSWHINYGEQTWLLFDEVELK